MKHTDEKGRFASAQSSVARKMSGKPTLFYKGYKPDSAQRISTGNPFWDSHLFVSSSKEGALAYGPKLRTFKAKPEAKILYHGTKEFRSIAKGLSRRLNLLDYSHEVSKRAKMAGYDAVHFERQSDVGTAINDPTKFEEI